MSFFNEFPGNRFYDGDLGWLLRRMHDLIQGKFADVHSLHVTDEDGNTILKAPDDNNGVYANELRLGTFTGDPELNVEEVGAELTRLYLARKYGAVHVRENAAGITGLTARFVRRSGVVTVEFKNDEGLAASLASSNQYFDMGVTELFRPHYNINTYQVIASRYTAQVNINSNGHILIGYTRNISDGQAADLPAGTLIRFCITYVSDYDCTFDEVQ